MDKTTWVDGPNMTAEALNHQQDAIDDALRSQARFLATGCIAGLQFDTSSNSIQPGEAYFEGRRIRVRTATVVDLSGVPNPGAMQYRWVSLFASWVTITTGTVRDDHTTEHPFATLDHVALRLAVTADDLTREASADVSRPEVPEGHILIADLLLGEGRAVDSVDLSRRTRCHPDRLQEDVDLLWAAVGRLQAAADAANARPPEPAAPTGTSASNLRVRWTYVAPDNTAAVITGFRLRWRIKGAEWNSNNIIARTAQQLTAEHTVPDATKDVEAQVRATNVNGASDWSPTGTLAAANIKTDPPIQSRRFDSAGAHSMTWGYRGTGRARITLRGGAGGTGQDGTAGEPGTSARRVSSSGGYVVSITYRIGSQTYISSYGTGKYATSSAAEAAAQAAAERINDRSDGTYLSHIVHYVEPSVTWVDGAAGQPGVAGDPGSPGAASTFRVAARSVEETANGGAGGAGGTPGAGGAGGQGANGKGRLGRAGGEGVGGDVGQTRKFDVSGLQHGDEISITVGAGGAGYPAGATGSVTVEPLN